MYTCCPHCQTCFRITKPQLDVAQGKVRCGHCQQIFNARQYLHAKLPTPAGAAPPPAAETPTPADSEQRPDFDLFDLDSIPESKEDESWIEDLAAESESSEDDEPTSVLDVSELARTLAEQDKPEDEDDILANLDEDEEEDDDLAAAMDDEEYNGDVLEGLDEDDDEEDATSIIEMRQLRSADLIPGDIVPVEETPDAGSDEASGRYRTGGEAQVDETDDANDMRSQYLYVDPEDLREEDKQIEDIMAEMDAQLNQSTESDRSMDSLFPDATADTEKDATPTAPSNQADDFEESFLGNLDASLAMTPPLSEPEPPAPHAAVPREPTRPATTSDSGVQPTPLQTDAFDDILTEATNQTGSGRGAQASRFADSTEIPARLRDSFVTESPPSRPLRKLAGFLFLLILAGALFSQLILFRSNALVSAIPDLQPLVEQVCQRLPCLYTGPVDVSRIKLVSRDIRLHPREKNALLISATFVNRAPFGQPYPRLTITLSDLGGEIVARRQFTPAEYLGRPVSISRLLPPGKPVQVTLEVVDPGKDAVNFEFTFQ